MPTKSKLKSRRSKLNPHRGSRFRFDVRRKPTKREMAVAIARDVLAQIRERTYLPVTGLYVNGAFHAGDLQSQLVKKKPTCEVCGLGSLFLSKVRLFDDFTLGEGPVQTGQSAEGIEEVDRDIIDPQLLKYFSKEELDAIEDFFEQREYGEARMAYDAPQLKRLMISLYGPAKRLEFLMKEVIRQRGFFNLARADKQAGFVNERAQEIKNNAYVLAIDQLLDEAQRKEFQ